MKTVRDVEIKMFRIISLVLLINLTNLPSVGKMNYFLQTISISYRSAFQRHVLLCTANAVVVAGKVLLTVVTEQLVNMVMSGILNVFQDLLLQQQQQRHHQAVVVVTDKMV